ncbi:hypothetical protein ABT024_05235 [Streptomyces sp. NPDC002812]|uniref:hypothetical protein n=1 Tax=Streptomyces sp. NPDC002812 TaxID=3154434 RepID=UPI003332FE82
MNREERAVNGERLESLPERQWLVCRMSSVPGQGVVVAVAADAKAAEESRTAFESAEPEEYFRVYAQTTATVEVSRTVKPGEDRWHVVEVEVTKYNSTTTQYGVVGISEMTAPSYVCFADRSLADSLCLLRNRLPADYVAGIETVPGLYNKPPTTMLRAACDVPGHTWQRSRRTDDVDLLVRDAEEHAAGAQERAVAYELKLVEDARAKELRVEEKREEAAERAWVRKNGPRATDKQQDFILTLRGRLEELGAGDSVAGPVTEAEVYDLTKASASTYIDILTAQVEKLQLARDRERFAVQASPAGQPGVSTVSS